ncbi:MAG: hypothetical protein ACXAB7_03420 [Candidatus Kariarchaeaceae archaeon]
MSDDENTETTGPTPPIITSNQEPPQISPVATVDSEIQTDQTTPINKQKIRKKRKDPIKSLNEALKKTRSIIFIDNTNIIHSAFAEIYAKHKKLEFSFVSAGIKLMVDEQRNILHSKTKEALRIFGIPENKFYEFEPSNVSDLTSQIEESSLLTSVFFTMTNNQKQVLEKQFGEDANIYLISILGGNEQDIKDPFFADGSIDVAFMNVFSTIKRCIDELEALIQKNKKVRLKDQRALIKAETIRRSRVIRRRCLRSLETLMSIEFRIKVYLTPINVMFRKHIVKMMEGQIEYLDEQISIIEEGNDILSQRLMEENLEKRASSQVFETLIEIVKEEIKRLEEEKPIITEILELDLKRLKDARLEPRACFWIVWSVGMQLVEIHQKNEKELNIVLDVIMRYPPVYKRVLAVFIHFAYNTAKYLDPFQIDSSRINLVPGPTGTGYNMAPWIKYRYGTNSQSRIEYEAFLEYYARSFGTIAGNAPDFEDGPKDGYQKWIQRILTNLETVMRKSPLIVANSKGDTLEGMLAGLIEELQEELYNREYEPEYNKLLNQPVGGEGALKFLEWLLETALRRYQTTNIAIHGPTRLSLDMFEFIEGTTRWINEFGERLVHDWLDPEA